MEIIEVDSFYNRVDIEIFVFKINSIQNNFIKGYIKWLSGFFTWLCTAGIKIVDNKFHI